MGVCGCVGVRPYPGVLQDGPVLESELLPRGGSQLAERTFYLCFRGLFQNPRPCHVGS